MNILKPTYMPVSTHSATTVSDTNVTKTKADGATAAMMMATSQDLIFTMDGATSPNRASSPAVGFVLSASATEPTIIDFGEDFTAFIFRKAGATDGVLQFQWLRTN